VCVCVCVRVFPSLPLMNDSQTNNVIHAIDCLKSNEPKLPTLFLITRTRFFHQFFMDKAIAIAGSKTMKAMLEGNFRESEDNVIRFPDIAGPVLERVIQYLYYKDKHTRTLGRLPEFKIEPEAALELLVTANYLEC